MSSNKRKQVFTQDFIFIFKHNITKDLAWFVLYICNFILILRNIGKK